MDKLPYITMGSGSLAAMSIFENGYHDDMTVRCLNGEFRMNVVLV